MPQTIANFKQSPEHVANYRRIRKRNIAILRGVLLKEDLEALAEKHGITVSVAKKAVVVLVRMLWFRSRDRKGVNTYPTRFLDLQMQADYWLDQLNENEEALQLLDLELHRRS